MSANPAKWTPPNSKKRDQAWLARIKIRTATRADLTALEWEGEYAHFRRLYAEAYRRTERGDALIWLAETEDGKLIGQLFVQLNSERRELADGSSRAYIYGFRVRPEYQSRGVGSRLMDAVENDLMRRGFRWAALNVGRDNEGARRLYERRNYRVVSSDPGYWSYVDDKGQRQEMHEPAWRMIKDLKQGK